MKDQLEYCDVKDVRTRTSLGKNKTSPNTEGKQERKHNALKFSQGKQDNTNPDKISNDANPKSKQQIGIEEENNIIQSILQEMHGVPTSKFAMQFIERYNQGLYISQVIWHITYLNKTTNDRKNHANAIDDQMLLIMQSNPAFTCADVVNMMLNYK